MAQTGEAFLFVLKSSPPRRLMATCWLCSESAGILSHECADCKELQELARRVPGPLLFEEISVWLHFQLRAKARNGMPQEKLSKFRQAFWESHRFAPSMVTQTGNSLTFTLTPVNPIIHLDYIPFKVKRGSKFIVLSEDYDLFFTGTQKQCELYLTWIRLVEYPRQKKGPATSAKVKVLNQRRYEALTGTRVTVTEENERQRVQEILTLIKHELEKLRVDLFSSRRIQSVLDEGRHGFIVEEKDDMREFVWVARGVRGVCKSCKERDWEIRSYGELTAGTPDLSYLCEHDCRCLLVALDLFPLQP